MRFLITKGSVDIEHNGKIARFWGDLCDNGFAAIASKMLWITPEGKIEASDEERIQLIKEVKRYGRGRWCKIRFYDDNGKRYKVPKG